MEKELAQVNNITLERGGLMIYPEFLKGNKIEVINND